MDQYFPEMQPRNQTTSSNLSNMDGAKTRQWPSYYYGILYKATNQLYSVVVESDRSTI